MTSERAILFGPDSGFHHARFAREPIRVERVDWVKTGMRYWNKLAGWNLFVFADEPEIVVRHELDSGCGICAGVIEPDDAWQSPYVKCAIAVYKEARDTSTIAHELGHCLGLRHRRRGVMSHDTPRRIPKDWKRHDRRLLLETGYRDAEAA